MEFRIEHHGDSDFGTLVAIPGQDDSFEVGGVASRGEVFIRFALYRHEAEQLIETVRPLAEHP